MHKVFKQVADIIDLPLINIIDETAIKAQELGLNTLGLLGTKHTMSDGFYQEKLSKFDINALVPNSDQQEVVHKIIVEELDLQLLDTAIIHSEAALRASVI